MHDFAGFHETYWYWILWLNDEESLNNTGIWYTLILKHGEPLGNQFHWFMAGWFIELIYYINGSCAFLSHSGVKLQDEYRRGLECFFVCSSFCWIWHHYPSFFQIKSILWRLCARAYATASEIWAMNFQTVFLDDRDGSYFVCSVIYFASFMAHFRSDVGAVTSHDKWMHDRLPVWWQPG